MPGWSRWGRWLIVMGLLGGIAGVMIVRPRLSGKAEVRASSEPAHLLGIPASQRAVVDLATSRPDRRDLPADARVSIDPDRVAEAVRRGTAWLCGRLPGSGPDVSGSVSDGDGLCGLMLYVLMLEGRLKPGDEELSRRIQLLQSVPPVTVRAAATRIMAFTRFEPPAPFTEEPRFRKDIIRCAQYLVDSQGSDGSWGVGTAMDLPVVSDLNAKLNTPSSIRFGIRRGIRRRGWGADGDATSTGWAVSGMNACVCKESFGYLLLPMDCFGLLETWLTDAQNPDGGWGERRGEKSIGRATAVGLTGLSWRIRLLGLDPDKDVRIQKAYVWIRGNVAPGGDGAEGGMTADQRVYCLRRAADSMRRLRGDPGDVVERALQHILDRQDADGGWGSGLPGSDRDWETCRAILALRMP